MLMEGCLVKAASITSLGFVWGFFWSFALFLGSGLPFIFLIQKGGTVEGNDEQIPDFAENDIGRIFLESAGLEDRSLLARIGRGASTWYQRAKPDMNRHLYSF